MKYILSTLILIYGLSSAAAPTSSEILIKTAKAVKAIYDKGFSLPQIVDVSLAEQQSSPPKTCVMVIYERRPNTICPDDPMIGPNLDKGYAACFDPATQEVDLIIGVQTPDC